MSYSFCGGDSPAGTIKNDMMAEWMEQEWIANHPETEWITVTMGETPLELLILEQFTDETVLEDGYRFARRIRTENTTVPYIFDLTWKGEPDSSTGYIHL